MSGEHDWQLAGRQGIHVEFPTKIKGRRSLFAIYVRCSRCNQNGFRRPNIPVVYTWDSDPVNWLVE